MKNIIILVFALFMGNLMNGQDYNQLAESAAKDLKISKSALDSFKVAYIAQLKKDLNRKPTTPTVSNPTNICDDGGFETKDFSNWGWKILENTKNAGGIINLATITGATGRSLETPITIPFVMSAGIPTLPKCPDGGSIWARNKWKIIPTGLDPLVPGLSTTHSGNYALKLGDKIDKPSSPVCEYPWCSAESVQKTITVVNSNKKLEFWYALVTCDVPSSAGHNMAQSAGFGVRINGVFRTINSLPINIPSNPIYTHLNTNLINLSNIQGQTFISYRPWTCANIDLTQFIGQTITVEFIVFDCINTGCFSYAYIDDICMGCEKNTPSNSCCENTLKMSAASLVPPSYPYNNGTYAIEQYNVNTASSVPITEIKIQTVGFEWIDSPEDCKQCQIKSSNLGSLFGGISIGGVMNGSTAQPYGGGANLDINNNEVVFTFPFGQAINPGDILKLTYILPPDKDLSCCHTKAKVCRKISWTDTNCNYCEVYDCSTVDLKVKSNLATGFPMPDLLMLYLNTRGLYPTGHAKGY